MNIYSQNVVVRGSAAAICAAGMSFLALGCQAPEAMPARDQATPVAGQPSTGGSESDTDRSTLGRLVGVWKFEGWSTQDGERRESSGTAAGAIENRYFVLLDIQASGGQLGGGAGRKSGSLLFASEPGIGLTVTAWGDASPSIRRLIGHAKGNASALSYDELHAPEGLHRVALSITFQSSDRWTAEIRDSSAGGRPVVASYTFTRE